MIALRKPVETPPSDSSGRNAVDNRARKHIKKGNELYEVGRFADALREYEAALSLRPDLAEGLVNRGIARGSLGDILAELEDYAAALTVSPDLAEAHYNQALAMASINKNNEALASVNHYLSLRPKDKHAKALHLELLDRVLWKLVEQGFARWSGGKPKGMKRPIRLKPGPPISDYIVEERERLRN